jgi:hypothetical protein
MSYKKIELYLIFNNIIQKFVHLTIILLIIFELNKSFVSRFHIIR